MTRSKNKLLIAMVCSFLAWLVATFLMGSATELWYTASGAVDMLDPIAIERTFTDPRAFFLQIASAVGAFVLMRAIWSSACATSVKMRRLASADFCCTSMANTAL